MNPQLRRLRARWTMAVTWKWCAFLNWRAGYRWDVVRRCRICEHTTPSHYRLCPEYQTPLPSVNAL